MTHEFEKPAGVRMMLSVKGLLVGRDPARVWGSMFLDLLRAGQSRTTLGTATLIASFAMAFPDFAEAQTVVGTDPATMVNNICTFILGPFGQSIAVLGIVAIGVAWMFGRASLGLIAGVIGGVVIMFGASYLGQTITGGG
jgi:type IV secretory pathway VirB2 component (pilin)